MAPIRISAERRTPSGRRSFAFRLSREPAVSKATAVGSIQTLEYDERPTNENLEPRERCVFLKLVALA
ncbi:unnamed protein product, partial [Nesidiocoris tenuis]